MSGEHDRPAGGERGDLGWLPEGMLTGLEGISPHRSTASPGAGNH